MSDLSVRILSDLVIFNKYAKFIDELGRRETWEEICLRNQNMHIRKYPNLNKEIRGVYQNFVVPKKVLPSMRSLQFGGRAIEMNEARIYNCCYLPIDSIEAFQETMFLLLSGTGVGYSVQRQHVKKLPSIKTPLQFQKHMVQDSIVGWSDAVSHLFYSYMGNSPRPVFDFRDIRPKGAPLKTSGGRAPGPDKLRESLERCEMIMISATGRQLTTLEVHDCLCILADAVISGGIRRAAMISIFSNDDQAMAECKSGEWWTTHPERGRSNNSAVFLRSDDNYVEFNRIFEAAKASNAGEPGILWTDDLDWGVNPCAEIALRPFQFCNLCEINASDVDSQEELEKRSEAAAFLGTLQAGYSDFYYLRPIWRETTQKEALLGVSMTGIASGAVLKLDLKAAAEIAVKTNQIISSIIGINSAARVTTIKPAGTTSLVLGSSSGIHGWWSPFYIRRMEVNKTEPIYAYLAKNFPDLIEDDVFKPDVQAKISIPVKAPEGAIYREEDASTFLDRILLFSKDRINPGHVSGINRHNVSATVNVRKDEWDIVKAWMWDNRQSYMGLSLLPFDDHTYVQAPHEPISESTYKRMLQSLVEIDLTKIDEKHDLTSLAEELACFGGGSCELK